MSAKLTIFVLSSFLLWASFYMGPHYNRYSDQHEIKMAGEFTCMAIVQDKDFILKKALPQITTAPLNFAVVYVSQTLQSLRGSSYFIKRPVRYYLLFKVLLN